MKAVLFHGPEDLRLEELPTPEPRRGEIRIRPQAVGLCGSDTHMLRGEMPAARPVVFGHEIAGIVDAVGHEVSGVDEGDLVTIEPHVYCKSCRYCRLGREHLCLQKKAFGVHLNGGLAERLVVPAYTAFRLPPGIGAEVGCLAEPVACCIHGMDRLAPASGTPLLIIGAGPAGLILTRLARLAGAAPIVVSEPNAERRKAALDFGADVALDPGADGWGEALEQLTDGQGFDSVIEAVGSAATLEVAVERTARGGRVLVFGVAPMDAVARVRPYEMFARELTLIGTVINPYTHDRAVGLLPRLGLDRLDFATYPLDDFQAAFAAQASGDAGLKVEIYPHT
jgi:2-desacetyl-2-hydroxyethyl bacteriochlorophyllide A dehydrogenase